jgi:hypothetical protein
LWYAPWDCSFSNNALCFTRRFHPNIYRWFFEDWKSATIPTPRQKDRVTIACNHPKLCYESLLFHTIALVKVKEFSLSRKMCFFIFSHMSQLTLLLKTWSLLCVPQQSKWAPNLDSLKQRSCSRSCSISNDALPNMGWINNNKKDCQSTSSCLWQQPLWCSVCLRMVDNLIERGAKLGSRAFERCWQGFLLNKRRETLFHGKKTKSHTRIPSDNNMYNHNIFASIINLINHMYWDNMMYSNMSYTYVQKYTKIHWYSKI